MFNNESDLEVGALPQDFGNFSICFDEDKTLAENIHNALMSLDTNDVAFFDLGLSVSEREALHSMQIKSFQNWGLFDKEVNYLPEIAESFAHNFLLTNETVEHALAIVGIITKIVRAAISELSYDSCKITLRTYPTDHRHTTLHWHIDKQHEETLGIYLDAAKTQTNFFITLKGPNTLFYPVNQEFREDWNKVALELPFAYGGSVVQHLIANKSAIISAEVGQGSIHKAGKMHGTIHARPFPEDGRFMLMITPGNFSTVQQLMMFEDYHIQAAHNFISKL